MRALAVCALAAGAVTGTARAGTYTVESCMSAGQPGIAGWVASTNGAYTYIENACNSGSVFQGFFRNDVEHVGDHLAIHRFKAPSDTSISSMSALRSASAGGYRPYGNSVAMLQADGKILEECQQYYGCSSLGEAPVSFVLGGARELVFGAFCTGPAGCPAGLTAYRMRQVKVELADVDDPIITGQPTGSLTSTAANLPRLRTLTYAASDQGGGVFRHRLFVDGVVARMETVNTNGGKCVTPFRDPVPCRTSPTSASIELDTGTLSDGPHTLRLEVSDATDQNRVQTAPWTIRVGAESNPTTGTAGGSSSTNTTTNSSTTINEAGLNTISALPNPVSAPLANGVPAIADARLSARFATASGARLRTSTRIVAGYAQRLQVRGTLQTPASRPIAGAGVHLAHKPLGSSEPSWRVIASATTTGDGSFTFPVPPGGRSRDLRVVYFPVGGSDVNRVSNPLTLQVRQDASLQVSRRVLRNGGRLVFRGRVLGEIPTGGIVVRMQVRLNRSWFTFTKPRTTRARGGRFQAAHRFTKTTRPTTYRFRVLVLPRDRSVHSAGFSRYVDVRVRS